VVQTKTAAEHVIACASQVICKAHARTEILVVITGQLVDKPRRQRTDRRNRLHLLNRAALSHLARPNHVKLFFPTQTEIYGPSSLQLPVILEVDSKLLGSSLYVRRRIAIGDCHSGNCARSGESLCPLCRVKQILGIIGKVDFERRVELEISTE